MLDTNFVLAGQHTVESCRIIREAAQTAGEEPPKWTTVFRAKRVRPCSREILERIAGREQARSEMVLHSTVSQKVKLFLREYERSPSSSKGALLEEVWTKSGCTEASDGTKVSGRGDCLDGGRGMLC